MPAGRGVTVGRTEEKWEGRGKTGNWRQLDDFLSATRIEK